MPKYICPKCKGVFCGWSVKHKYKEICPNCGSELQEVYDDNRELEVYDDNRELRRDPIVKLSKTINNLKKW